MSKPVTMHCVYRPKPGSEEALFDLVKKHWPVLRDAGLATAEPALVWRATDKRSGKLYFIEVFSWTNAEAPGLAHQLPEVMKIWEPMGPMIEGGPSPELAFVEPVRVG
jgi:hypothetical protein